MTLHPAKGLTPAQKAAFELLAIGQDPRCVQKTYDALEKAKLVTWNEKTVGKDRLGPVRIREYRVAQWAHIQWCRWCAEQPVMVPTTALSSPMLYSEVHPHDLKDPDR